MIKAHQPTTGALVVAALALQVIEADRLEGGGDHRQKHRFHSNHFHRQMIGRQQLMVKALARKPKAHRARRQAGDGRAGRLVCRGGSGGGLVGHDWKQAEMAVVVAGAG